jgi:transposase
MSKSRRKFKGDFKAKVVLEVLKERESLQTIAAKYELHPTQVGAWKQLAIEQLSNLFEGRPKSVSENTSPLIESELYEQIGRLKMELEWLKKKLPTIA